MKHGPIHCPCGAEAARPRHRLAGARAAHACKAEDLNGRVVTTSAPSFGLVPLAFDTTARCWARGDAYLREVERTGNYARPVPLLDDAPADKGPQVR